MSSWVKLYRSLDNWEWASNPNIVALFVRLLIMASYETRQWKGKTINRGQLFTGRRELSNRTGLSEQQIRTSLNKLKSTNEITIESTNEGMLITVVNYSKYQGDDVEATNKPTNDLTNEQPTNNQQITTIKESKEIYNLNNNIYNNPPYPPKEEKTGPSKKYVFEGHVVKLIDRDFKKWKEAYPLVDLTGILSKFDAWVKDQGEDVRKNWFIRCSNYLAKKNKQLEERVKQPNPAVKPSPKADKSEDEKSIWDYYDQYNIPYDPEMRRAHECR